MLRCTLDCHEIEFYALSMAHKLLNANINKQKKATKSELCVDNAKMHHNTTVYLLNSLSHFLSTSYMYIARY